MKEDCILDQAFFNILEMLNCPPKNRGFFMTILNEPEEIIRQN